MVFADTYSQPDAPDPVLSDERVLESTSLSGPARVAVLEELGATLRRVHEIDQAAMLASGLIPGDERTTDLFGRHSAMIEYLIAVLAEDERWALEIDLRAVADECMADLPGSTPPVTLHSNPGPEHCFVDLGSGRFSGLIDFGDAYRSHPALDVRSWASPDDSRQMLAGYRALGSLPDGFEQVWRTGLIVTELRLAARGHRQPTDVAATIRRLENETDREAGR